jgi:hypothetical protein
MRWMDAAEINRFLSHGTRTGKLAITRKDGRASVTPIWFVLDDEGRIVFTTGGGTLKANAMRRTGRAALCVDDEREPFAFVSLEGTVELSEDLDEMLVWATRIAARYMGDERAEAFGRRNAVEGELLARLTREHVVGADDLTS